jgi:hypothetical protein
MMSEEEGSKRLFSRIRCTRQHFCLELWKTLFMIRIYLKIGSPRKAVTPVKTGVHLNWLKIWIPAKAGMTEKEQKRLLIRF